MKNQLKVLRIEREMTQQQLADALNVKITTYRAWENGYRNMSLSDACKCATVLNCTLDELAGYTPKSETKYYVIQLNEDQKNALLGKEVD